MFSVYVPFLVFSCHYSTISIRLLMIVCLILFSEKQKPVSLLSAGFLLACSVLYQPSFAFLYFGFTALVLIRFFRGKKHKPFLDDYAFCLNIRAWIYISITVFLSAAVFLIWLLARSGLRNILTNLPFIFTDPSLDYSVQGNAKFFFSDKLMQIVRFYGLVCVIPAVLIVILSVMYAFGGFRKRRAAAKNVLFCLACAVWMVSCVSAFHLSGSAAPLSFFSMYPAPLFWFGFVCYLLSEKKNKRFFFFWIVGLCTSLSVDFLSAVSLSFGSPITYIADLAFFVSLVREIRDAQFGRKTADAHGRRDPKRAKIADAAVRWFPRLTCLCFAAWFSFVLVFENSAFSEHYAFGTPLFLLPSVCAQGPWRSLHVTQTVGQDYALQLADIDTIREKQSKNLCILGETPALYLYTDQSCATFSIWTLRRSIYVDRNITYWKMNPDKQPDCIYIPTDHTYNNHGDAAEQIAWIREQFDPLCDYTAEQGQGGYILYVSQWHPDAEATVS